MPGRNDHPVVMVICSMVFFFMCVYVPAFLILFVSKKLACKWNKHTKGALGDTLPRLPILSASVSSLSVHHIMTLGRRKNGDRILRMQLQTS